METTVTNKEFVQRVYVAPGGQDRDGFPVLYAEDFPAHSGDDDFQSLDVANQNSAVAGHRDVAWQRRRRYVSR